jgi:uncharacterized protein with gpF-like domain
MQRLGIPRPLFSIEDRLAQLLKARYRTLARKLLKELKAQFAKSGVVTDKAPEDDNLESLLQFFEEMGKQAREEQEEIANRANAQSVANTLEHEWFDEQQEELERLDEQFKGDIDKVFKREQSDYLKRLFDDADDRFKNVLVSFSIDKKQFFNNNMDAVRTLYVDNSLERIAGEQDLIKRKILKQITDYALNQSDTLNLHDILKEAYDSGDTLAHLFARDQMQRFNKACTLSTFRSAGVTKVKWVTANDGRVRNKSYVDKQGRLHRAHTELAGQIFNVNNLPLEIDDYNCRCGLVPVEWQDD